eukprot:13634048-Ditylum_brightwellii.AAC.1
MEPTATLKEDLANHLTVTNIKEYLIKRGKRLAGNKSELLQSLEIILYWQPLILNEQSVLERINEGATFKAPTVVEDEISKPKYGFKEKFIRA